MQPIGLNTATFNDSKPETTPRDHALAAVERADKMIHGDRRDAYGPVERSYEGIADVWTGLLWRKLAPGQRITRGECLLMMTALKLCREMVVEKPDNIDDGHGYLMLYTEQQVMPK